MTLRRFNYTGCQRIRRTDVFVVVNEDGAGHFFEATVDLKDYSLPTDAVVVMEAYVDWSVMRFPFGRVGCIENQSDTHLTEFDSLDGLRFRCKVLGVGDHAGLILAEADGIRPSSDDDVEEARSFIIARGADLGSVVWKLSFDEAQPILLINDRIPDWKDFLRRADIRSLLFPEVVRQVLREAAHRDADDEDPSEWPAYALALARSLGAGDWPSPDFDDELEMWLDDTVRKFAQRHRMWNGVAQLLDQDS